MLTWVPLVPLFPLLGVLVNGLLGRWLGKRTIGLIACGTVGLSFALSLALFATLLGHPEEGRTFETVVYTWIGPGELQVPLGFRLDPLSVLMMLVVTGVGLFIHIYSIGYMHDDRDYRRYFTYLNLFMLSMLVLVTANNYLLLFVGWEGVGLCSYLLIGFWYERKAAADAGKKAFVVNRIGDAGFLLGVFLLYKTFHTLDFTAIFQRAPQLLQAGEVNAGLLTAITLLLFVGAVGKSAQFPLHVWLPDAMEGPTPVSALIHAATMVTAGVYMVARSSPLFSLAPFSLELVAALGAFTAILAASIALVQNDIKRVLAYSTVSQLGYMFLGAGVGAYAAAIFHLMTHAFFKGLLFLSSGSVIHALDGEQDMRRMGGLRPHLPVTGRVFYIGALALAGIPPLAGFWSKDEILAEAFKSGHYLLWAVGVVTAFMTAFYIFRLIYLTFFGQSRLEGEAAHHLHESPPVMTVPLVILAALSLLGGAIPGFPPEGGWIHHFLAPALVSPGHEPAASSGILDGLLMATSVAMGLIGWALARWFYVRRPDLPAALAARLRPIYQLLLNKYWIDELYDLLIVNPCKRLAQICLRFDQGVVDGSVNGLGQITVTNSTLSGRFDQQAVDGSVNGISTLIRVGAQGFRLLQTGFIQNYALAMLLGIFVLVSVYLLL